MSSSSMRRRLVALLVLAAAAAAPPPASAEGRPGPPGGVACSRPVLAEALPAARVRQREPDAFAAASARRTARGAGLARLSRDRSVWLDRCGAPFYVEPVHAAAEAEPRPDAAVPPGTDVFALESDPGAQRTIYLDFRGGTVSGSAWSSYAGVDPIVAAPMSLDGQVDTVFSAAELEAVYQAWLVVAEDFAPFGVNVTTRDPGAAALERSSSADQQYGTRVMVTTGGPIYEACGCGGVAYLDVFGHTSRAYQPAWVFADGLYSGWNIGQAASHEVGHNFGLAHDGSATRSYYSGHGPWAPIMGVSYGRVLSQWSRGEYAGATNREDDVATIARHAPLRGDDHGDHAAASTGLEMGRSVDGVLASAADVDAFSLAARGEVTVSVGHPSGLDTDLDLRLTVLDAEGHVLEVVDPQPGTGGWFVGARVDGAFEAVWRATLPVTPTPLVLLVEGTGSGDPLAGGWSDYGSLGRYRLTVSPDTVPEQPLGVDGPTSATVAAGTPFTVDGLTASGGLAPYGWDGVVPDGVRVDRATGRLSGTLATVPDGGSVPAVVTVTDALGQSASTTVTLVVEAPAVEPTIRPGRLDAARKGRRYREVLSVHGAVGQVAWQVVDRLPRGLRLRHRDDASRARLVGVPRRAGRQRFTVQVTDLGTGLVETRRLTLRVRRR